MNTTTRVVRNSGRGYIRRAVYLDGRHVGYTTSILGGHTGQLADGTVIEPPGDDVCWSLLRDAVAAVGQAAQASGPVTR